MTRSDKSIIGLALAPPIAYVTAIVWCLIAGVSLPAGPSTIAGGGAFVAMASVGFANVVRLRRDGAGYAGCSESRTL